VSSFDLSRFWRFCSHLSINSKEFGTIKLDKPYGPQRWALNQIAKGLDEGIHDFTHLKCRQIGLSTIVLALDLYWPFTHKGMDATVITHDEDAHVSFRTQLGEYYNSLPKGFKPRSPSHNRTEFVFRFNSGEISRLQYQIAGTRASGNNKLGRSKGNAYVHATEMAFWGDQQGYSSLRNALAETNPHRLYVWESTANGYNQFEEQWRVARKATTQRAIFVSWWAHEQYRVHRDSQVFKIYWGVDGKMTSDERRLSRDVGLLYGDAMQFVNGTKEITPEQIAWFRWYSEEKVADPDMVMQEMPWTEHQAFIVTGSQYFAARDLTPAHKRISAEPEPQYFRVEIRQTMTDSQVLVVPRKVSNLHVYEGPVPGAQYVLGADPAYGSSDWADRFVISVWRVYADRIEQVAEYANADCLTYAFAWIMCYLVGCYGPCAWNLEVNGPGAAVLAEIDNLKKQQFSGSEADRRTLKNFLAGMKEFLWSKQDAIQRRPTARGTVSTHKEKTRYMATFKDYFARGMVVPHSRELIEEMKWIVTEPGQAPAAAGRKKDDRVIAAALAVQMWQDKLRPDLMRKNITFTRTKEEPTRTMTVVERIAARQRLLMGQGPGQVQGTRR
jgi:hypothetical protein